jgi:methionyl-tRNA formyltransferase
VRRSLVYLGTPALAVPPLRALVEAGHDVRLVVTRPDRRRGRGTGTSASPVKAEAERLGLPVAHELDAVGEVGAELGVVVAYGRIVPAQVLERVPMVNLHFSLLPRWRGAAPVERAILAGDEVTGVCVMALEAELDTGPLYASREVSIAPGEHLGPLRDRLVEAGTRLLVDVLGRPLAEPEPQRGEATYAEKLDPRELRLTWSRPADELARVVRLDRAWTTWRGRRLLVLDAEAVAAPGAAPPPGSLVGAAVVTGEGALALYRVQLEGRATMPADDWLRGARLHAGELLGGS